MRDQQTEYVALTAWAVVSSWVVGFLASVAPSPSVLAAALLSSAGAVALVPDIWRKGHSALAGAAALVLPWALNAHIAPVPVAKVLTLGGLVLLLGVWAAVVNPGWLDRIRRRR